MDRHHSAATRHHQAAIAEERNFQNMIAQEVDILWWWIQIVSGLDTYGSYRI